MSIDIEELTPAALEAALDGLAEVLHASVLDGASVGFVLPFTVAEARRFWEGQRGAVAAGDKRILVAREGGRILGTTTLIVGMPPNGRQRGEIAKVLVHPAARRRGIARMLMLRAEATARRDGRRTLVLDTAGEAAERLYLALGWRVAGVVPNYALNIHGVPERTIFMFKELPADA
jgi:ribosomal protein S18 acetylase RimI-like enzyme